MKIAILLLGGCLSTGLPAAVEDRVAKLDAAYAYRKSNRQ